MKSSYSLDLLVRTAAGVDLFPGESSGYNSSASSITGDQSPCWGDQASKRLSIVKEEDGTEKYISLTIFTRFQNQINNKNFHFSPVYRLGYLRPKSWDRVDLDRRKDRLHAVKPPKIPNSSYSNNNNYHHDYNQQSTNTQQNNKTIIQLSSNGTLINNTLIPSNNNNNNNNSGTTTDHENKTTTVFLGNDDKVTIKENSHIRNNIKVNCNQMDCRNNNSGTTTNGPKGTKIADICLVSRQSETKTVIVEVHRSPSDECNGDGGCTKSSKIPPPPPPMVSLQTANHPDRNSLSSSMSIPSSCDGISLSSAISEELKKRAEVISFYSSSLIIYRCMTKYGNIICLFFFAEM